VRKRFKPRSQLTRRIFDYVVYLTVGGLVCWAAFFFAAHGPVNPILFRWIGLIGITPITFGYPLSGVPRRLRSRTFWITWATLLVMHLVAYALVLSSVGNWGLMNFAVINVVEIAGVSMVLDWVLRFEAARRSLSRG